MLTAISRKKKLRIKEEYLPDSAIYGTIDGKEYIMLPVEDFGGWLEDIEDRLAVEEAREDPTSGISLEELLEKANRTRKGKK